jgi:hypothetical protein
VSDTTWENIENRQKKITAERLSENRREQLQQRDY